MATNYNVRMHTTMVSDELLDDTHFRKKYNIKVVDATDLFSTTMKSNCHEIESKNFIQDTMFDEYYSPAICTILDDDDLWMSDSCTMEECMEGVFNEFHSSKEDEVLEYISEKVIEVKSTTEIKQSQYTVDFVSVSGKSVVHVSREPTIDELMQVPWSFSCESEKMNYVSNIKPLVDEGAKTLVHRLTNSVLFERMQKYKDFNPDLEDYFDKLSKEGKMIRICFFKTKGAYTVTTKSKRYGPKKRLVKEKYFMKILRWKGLTGNERLQETGQYAWLNHKWLYTTDNTPEMAYVFTDWGWGKKTEVENT